MGINRRTTNTVQVGSLLRWVVIAVFLGIAGLSYVYLSNQTQRTGTEMGKIENDLKRLKDKNDEAEGTIARLSSVRELQRRLEERFINLVPITEDRIVRVAVPLRSTDEIRPVANGGPEK